MNPRKAQDGSYKAVTQYLTYYISPRDRLRTHFLKHYRHILLPNLDIWDSLKIGISILCDWEKIVTIDICKSFMIYFQIFTTFGFKNLKNSDYVLAHILILLKYQRSFCINLAEILILSDIYAFCVSKLHSFSCSGMDMAEKMVLRLSLHNEV